MGNRISMAELVAEKCFEKALVLLENETVPTKDTVKAVSDLVRVANEAKLTQDKISFFPG